MVLSLSITRRFSGTGVRLRQVWAQVAQRTEIDNARRNEAHYSSGFRGLVESEDPPGRKRAQDSEAVDNVESSELNIALALTISGFTDILHRYDLPEHLAVPPTLDG